MSFQSGLLAQPGPGNPQKLSPFLFSHLQESFTVSLEELENIFAAGIGDTLELASLERSPFLAVLTDRVQRNSGAISANLRLVKFPGAFCNLSKSINLQEEVIFQGRILHPRFADAYFLHRDTAGYIFRRDFLKTILVE